MFSRAMNDDRHTELTKVVDLETPDQLSVEKVFESILMIVS